MTPEARHRMRGARSGRSVGVVMVRYRVEPRTRRQRTQPAKIGLLEPKQHNNVAEYDVAGILYPGKLDNDLITKCPMVDAPGAAMPLRD